MKKYLKICEKIKPYNKSITIDGDKSLSIRWALIASQASGKSTSFNLLKSDDVLNTLSCLKKLGVKIKIFKNKCEIFGNGLNSFKYKKNIVLNAGNSGTLGRLILGLLVHSKYKIKIKGDKSLSKRDFLRVTKPLEKFGANFETKNGRLPIIIYGTNNSSPINYIEERSAQCKSSIMLAALNTTGTTFINAKKSRDHTELLLKYLKLPIKIKKDNKKDFIAINGKKNIKPLNYKIPSDMSSGSFFIILTALSKKSKLKIKNVNINPTESVFLKFLK